MRFFRLKAKTRNIALLSTMILFFVLLTPIALAKTRQSYLTDFLFANQDGNEKFGSSYQDTAYSLEIIAYYETSGLFGSEVKVDKTEFGDNLISALNTMFNEGDVQLFEIYYIINTLKNLDAFENLDSSLETKISTYINQTAQGDGGFSLNNLTSSADMTSTYFAYEIKTYMNEEINTSLTTSWILSCNNSDGGYGGNSSLNSSQLTTYLAVYLIDQIADLNDLENRTATLNYFNSFIVNDNKDLYNYGGYLPGILSDATLFSSTYYCVSAINLLDSTQLSKIATTNWILNRQNFEDGGFSNYFGGTVQGLSSISASYHAFKMLGMFGNLGLLNEDIFMVEFNFIILIILLVVIAVIIALLYFVWQKRKI